MLASPVNARTREKQVEQDKIIPEEDQYTEEIGSVRKHLKISEEKEKRNVLMPDHRIRFHY